ncbi:MAG: hypothetical protein WA705_07895 [Candidatus Ozemobacteraceae bacterium]
MKTFVIPVRPRVFLIGPARCATRTQNAIISHKPQAMENEEKYMNKRTWMGTVKSLFAALRNAVIPFSCHLCGKRSEWGQVCCASCETSIAALIHSPTRVEDVSVGIPIFTLGRYEEPLSTAIRAVKYRPSLRLWEHLGPLLQTALAGSDFSTDIVIPVPLFIEREQKRGFNQATLLARTVETACGAAYSPALQRSRSTRPQADCTEEERSDNLAGAFSLADGLRREQFRRRRLTLIDDVATTGSTLACCARVLESLQPVSLNALVVAHSYLRRSER